MQDANKAHGIGTFDMPINHNVGKYHADSDMRSQYWTQRTTVGMICKSFIQALKTCVESLGCNRTSFAVQIGENIGYVRVSKCCDYNPYH